MEPGSRVDSLKVIVYSHSSQVYIGDPLVLKITFLVVDIDVLDMFTVPNSDIGTDLGVNSGRVEQLSEIRKDWL